VADFETSDDLRAFLRLCIDPGTRRAKRTPTHLVQNLPKHFDQALTEHAPPVLRSLQRATADLAERYQDVMTSYAAALLAWVRDDAPTASDALRKLVEAAHTHAAGCGRCLASGSGFLSPHCPEGGHLALALLTPEEARPCA
jgi:hypothetical protein